MFKHFILQNDNIILYILYRYAGEYTHAYEFPYSYTYKHYTITNENMHHKIIIHSINAIQRYNIFNLVMGK